MNITKSKHINYFQKLNCKGIISTQRILFLFLVINFVVIFKFHFLVHDYDHDNVQSYLIPNEYTKDRKSIPPKEVESLYGNKVIIHGLDQCRVYRDKIPGNKRYIVPAGLHNTGTNLLYKLLQRNCYIPERWAKTHNTTQTPFTPEMETVYDCFSKECERTLDEFDFNTGMRKNAAWWKHAPPSFRDKPPYLLSRISHSYEGEAYDRMNALPIVMIKDPINWMSSMCRNPYEVKFYSPREKCPKLVLSRHRSHVIVYPPPPEEGKVRKYSYKYNSLVDMWSDYYNEWITNTSFPNVMVRYEDLLFHPKQVINQVCTCAGGKMREDGSIHLVQNAAKNHGRGVSKKTDGLEIQPRKIPINISREVITLNSKKFSRMDQIQKRSNSSRTDLATAIILYGTKEIRDTVLDDEDKRFAVVHFNPNVMQIFNYKPP